MSTIIQYMTIGAQMKLRWVHNKILLIIPVQITKITRHTYGELNERLKITRQMDERMES